MTAALSKGVSWGIGEDAAAAAAGEDGSDGSVDWRTYASSHVRSWVQGQGLSTLSLGTAACSQPHMQRWGAQ